MTKHFVAVAFIILLFQSCSKEQFSVNKKEQHAQTAPVTTSAAVSCSGFTLVKPPVDFLFLWDNTSSQFFVTEQTKKSLNNTIDAISSRFDYHILMAPLVGYANNNSYLVVENPSGLSSSASSLIVPQSDAASRLSTFPVSYSSTEFGLQRSVDLIRNNVSNGIFRKNAYTVVVLMSNGDDVKLTSGTSNVDGPATETYILQKRDDLINLRDVTLTAEQLRFISLVSFSDCGSGFRQNYSYKKMSGLIYNSKIPPKNDQAGRPYPDSYDICTTDFTHLFDGINNSIQDSVISHVYDAWPITSTSALTFNPSKIKVKKNTGVEFMPVDGPSAGDGFKYIGYQTRNTRLLPSPGEPFTGHLLELYGSARVTYPECLIIETESPVDYYGYVQLQTKPLVSSIKLKINGVTINESSTSGWQYIGYVADQNMKIKSPTDFTPVTPGLMKTGYFLKLAPSVVYSNGATVDIVYDPAGI